MEMRDRLIELLQNFADGIHSSNGHFVDNTQVDDVADHLLANGVIVPPDYKTLLWTAENMLEQWNETTGAIAPHTSWYYELLSILEDTVKLSFGAGILYKEEAAKLKEREGNG